MCQGIFRFSNQNGSWYGQESAGKKSGNNSQLVGLQYGANVDENLSWHFSPKAGQVEIRKSEVSNGRRAGIGVGAGKEQCFRGVVDNDIRDRAAREV
jgi:hypothetical protein